jgi:hypothetical protein
MNHAAHTSCIRISLQKSLVSVPDGRCWLLALDTLELTPLPVSPVAAQRSSAAAAAVEGAIVAGLANARYAATSERYTLPRYIRWLAGNYIFAGQTPGLFRRAAERFRAAGRHDLAEFSLKKSAEEAGHARLAFRDLQALDLPAADVVSLVQPPSATAFADQFRAYVESTTPVSLFGFSYCLERMALGRDDAFVSRIKEICPPGSRAWRFLEVHSAVGSDSGHVHEQLSLFERFTDSELASVGWAAYQTAEMLRRQQLMDATLSDEEISRRLRVQGITLTSY